MIFACTHRRCSKVVSVCFTLGYPAPNIQLKYLRASKLVGGQQIVTVYSHKVLLLSYFYSWSENALNRKKSIITYLPSKAHSLLTDLFKFSKFLTLFQDGIILRVSLTWEICGVIMVPYYSYIQPLNVSELHQSKCIQRINATVIRYHNYTVA